MSLGASRRVRDEKSSARFSVPTPARSAASRSVFCFLSSVFRKMWNNHRFCPMVRLSLRFHPCAEAERDLRLLKPPPSETCPVFRPFPGTKRPNQSVFRPLQPPSSEVLR
ncbi:MAG: hypothetical protein LBD06_07405 [Candidatus Accumulibacter sp.]|nr:hypothetical protein [Accumulibacter sp.]